MSRTNPEDARQGRKGTPVLRVLIIALVLCVVAAAGMAVYGRMMSGDTPPAGKIGNGDGTSTSLPSEDKSTTPAPETSGTAPASPAPSN